MAKFVAGCTYTRERFRFQLALWVTHKCHPYAIVEDEELVAAFRTLHGLVDVPSQFSMNRDIKMMYHMTKSRLIATFEVCLVIKFPGSLANGVND